jgi:stress response protein YsnF
MARTVIGFFDDASDAQRAVERLQSEGISRQYVDVTRGDAGTTTVSNDRHEESGITRFFKSLFGDDNDDADRYSKVGRNSTIVTVHAQTEDEAERAADLLDDCGAIDVDERSAQYGYTSSGSSPDMSTSGREERTIPNIQENIEVGKREVERGGVRVRSRIVERPVEESVRLREEHVQVERTPVDRPVTDRDMANLQDRDIELTERSEVPVVNKEARVVEEVRISKDVDHREETIRDTVRETEIDVDKIDRTGRADRTGNTDITDYTDDRTDYREDRDNLNTRGTGL